MSVEETLVEKLRALPPDKQRSVLEFVESLDEGNGSQPQRRLLRGALSHLNIHISEDQITEARREMWPSYVREDSD
jgi:hypothetical protein